MSGGRGRRRRGMSTLPLSDHHAVRGFVFDGDEGWWAQLVVLRGRAGEVQFLNPHGHTLLEDADDVGLRTFRVGDPDEELSGREVSGPLPSALPPNQPRSHFRFFFTRSSSCNLCCNSCTASSTEDSAAAVPEPELKLSSTGMRERLSDC